MTAYGFIATIRSESTASASSAATWPESSSPSPERPSRDEPVAPEEPAERQKAAVHDQRERPATPFRATAPAQAAGLRPSAHAPREAKSSKSSTAKSQKSSRVR